MEKTINIPRFYDLIQPLINKPIQHVELGHGSFLLLSFGSVQTKKKGKRVVNFYEWLIWVYGSTWQIESNGMLVTSSEDEREVIQAHLSPMLGCRLIDLNVRSDNLNLTITIEGGILIRCFTSSVEEMEHWLLYMSDNMVIVAGPMDQFVYERSDQA
jgi:hypothetical protein